MSDAVQDSSGSPQNEKPKRNSMERIIVWGVIGLGLLIACTEGTARFGYSMSLNALQNRVHDDEAADANPLTIAEAEKLMVGFPKKEVGADQVVTFRFKGLVKEFGAIHLSHDDDNLVLGLKTDSPPKEPEPTVAPFDDDSSGMGEMGSFPAMEEGSPATEAESGDLENPVPVEPDENKDDKESPEESEAEKPAETESTPATEPEEAAKEE